MFTITIINKRTKEQKEYRNVLAMYASNGEQISFCTKLLDSSVSEVIYVDVRLWDILCS